jgi:hypothetical protein
MLFICFTQRLSSILLVVTTKAYFHGQPRGTSSFPYFPSLYLRQNDKPLANLTHRTHKEEGPLMIMEHKD